MSLDLVGACDVADMVRLETLTTDRGTLVGGHRLAEENVVRDRRANISQIYGGKWKECGRGNDRSSLSSINAWEAGTVTSAEKRCSRLFGNSLRFVLKRLSPTLPTR